MTGTWGMSPCRHLTALPGLAAWHRGSSRCLLEGRGVAADLADQKHPGERSQEPEMCHASYVSILQKHAEFPELC